MLQNPLQKEQGLALLMENFQKGLYWHIRKMVENHEDTDDILQNTFIKVWNYFDSFRAESALKTWVFRIATNECLNFIQKQKRQMKGDLRDIEDSMSHSVQASSTLTAEDIQAKLAQAIDTLPPKQRQVFLLKYYEEMKYAEMAETLGGSVGSLKASFHHAVKKIEEFLKQD